MTRLVVTADDLGLTDGVTRGILEAHRRGIVRSTSHLVTFPSSEAAAALAREEPDLEVGLHIDLVGGTPAGVHAKVGRLVGADGRFPGLRELLRRVLLVGVSARELADEIRAQVARARSWGLPAVAWDSHRHVHAVPQVARVVSAVARQEGALWVRRVHPGPGWHGPKAMALAAGARASEVYYRGIPGNTWYVDLSSWRPGGAAAVALLAAQGGAGEIGAHPGYPDAELRGVDGLTERRTVDLALLTDPLLRSALGCDAVAWRVG